jgi:hypothetical protein
MTVIIVSTWATRSPSRSSPTMFVMLWHKCLSTGKGMSQYGERNDSVSYASQLDGDGTEMADVLLVGDKFAVPTKPNNAEDVQFYVLECHRRKFLVRSAFKCKWGCEFEVGEYAVAGRYFQKWDRVDKSYVFLDGSCIAYIPANLVCHVKF